MKPCPVSWTEKWLNGWDQRALISGTKSSWRPATSDVPRDTPVLGLILLNIFLDDLDVAARVYLSKFADGTELGVVAYKLEDGAVRDQSQVKLNPR